MEDGDFMNIYVNGSNTGSKGVRPRNNTSNVNDYYDENIFDNIRHRRNVFTGSKNDGNFHNRGDKKSKKRKRNESDDKPNRNRYENQNDDEDELSISDIDLRNYDHKKQKRSSNSSNSTKRDDEVPYKSDFANVFKNRSPLNGTQKSNGEIDGRSLHRDTSVYVPLSLSEMEMESVYHIRDLHKKVKSWCEEDPSNNVQPQTPDVLHKKSPDRTNKSDENINRKGRSNSQRPNGVYSSHGFNNLMLLLEGRQTDELSNKDKPKDDTSSSSSQNEDNNQDEQSSEIETVGFGHDYAAKKVVYKESLDAPSKRPVNDVSSNDFKGLCAGNLTEHITKTLKERFGTKLTLANMSIEKMLTNVCPLCSYGCKDIRGIYATEITKIKNLYKRNFMSTSAESLAATLVFTWNTRVFEPIFKKGFAFMPLTYEMALDHIKRPHQIDAAFVAKKEIEDLTSMGQALKSMLFVRIEKEEDTDNIIHHSNGNMGSTTSNGKDHAKTDKDLSDNAPENGQETSKTSKKKIIKHTYNSQTLKDILLVSSATRNWIHSRRSDTVFNRKRTQGFMGTENSSTFIQL